MLGSQLWAIPPSPQDLAGQGILESELGPLQIFHRRQKGQTEIHPLAFTQVFLTLTFANTCKCLSHFTLPTPPPPPASSKDSPVLTQLSSREDKSHEASLPLKGRGNRSCGSRLKLGWPAAPPFQMRAEVIALDGLLKVTRPAGEEAGVRDPFTCLNHALGLSVMPAVAQKGLEVTEQVSTKQVN